MTWLSEIREHASFTPHHAQDFITLPTHEIVEVHSSRKCPRNGNEETNLWINEIRMIRSLEVQKIAFCLPS